LACGQEAAHIFTHLTVTSCTVIPDTHVDGAPIQCPWPGDKD
jgi:hypothetical protein